MKIIICNNKQEWDNWFLARDSSSFLQSWEWGEFQRSVGREPLRLIIEAENMAARRFQCFKHDLGFGVKYLYAPRIFSMEYKMLNEFVDFTRRQGYSFARIEPIQKLPAMDCQISVISNRQPQHTLILNISKSKEQILDKMHPKTRYNIRLARRKEVKVKDRKDVDVFWDLNKQTVNRDKFRSHNKEYYAKMLKMSSSYQLTAYLDNKPIAANILINFAGTMTYLHGASANEYRNAMAPYLLQWEGILLAKESGCDRYDFWGVAAPSGDSQIIKKRGRAAEICFHNFCWEEAHKWTGITRFKVGFGGVVFSYPQAVDIETKPFRYKLYKLARKFL